MTERNDNIPYLSFHSKSEEIMTPDEAAESMLLHNDSAVHKRLSFVHKLYLMLNELEAQGYDCIISWMGDGKAFKIHNPTLFEASIQPHYFRQSRLASFIRQCYGYGFVKIEDKGHKYFGAYVHPDFQRDDPTRACNIQRRRTLNNDRRFKNPSHESVRDQRSRPCGTDAYYSCDSFSSLETLPSSGDKKPDARLDTDWNHVASRIVSVNTSDSALPSHIATVDDWSPYLLMSFSSPSYHQNTPFPSNEILSFAELTSLFEPRPIELMIQK